MKIEMKVAELSWRELEHNQFSGRISSIKCRGRVWASNSMSKNISSDLNLGWFYSNVPEQLNELILETYHLIEVELMERNVIPKAWPEILTNKDHTAEYPFEFRLKETCLVNTNWRMHDEDAPQTSYCLIEVLSKHHQSTTSKIELNLPEEHIEHVFLAVDELL
jgi:hypothetical protein